MVALLSVLPLRSVALLQPALSSVASHLAPASLPPPAETSQFLPAPGQDLLVTAAVFCRGKGPLSEETSCLAPSLFKQVNAFHLSQNG